MKTPTVTAGNLSEFRCRFVGGYHRLVARRRERAILGLIHILHIFALPSFPRSDTALSPSPVASVGGLLCGNTFIGSSIKPISFLSPSNSSRGLRGRGLTQPGGDGGAAAAPAAQCGAKWNFLLSQKFLLAGSFNEEDEEQGLGLGGQ